MQRSDQASFHSKVPFRLRLSLCGFVFNMETSVKEVVSVGRRIKGRCVISAGLTLFSLSMGNSWLYTTTCYMYTLRA